MKKIPFPIALLAVVIVAALVGWGITHLVNQGSSHSKSNATSSAASRVPSRLPKGWAYVASVRPRTIAVRSSPHGRVIARLSNPNPVGSRLVLLVRRLRGRWIQTYLPQRPDGSIGWVSRRSVKLATTSWSLSVHLRSHRLLLFREGKLARNFSIGVGESVTPTPTGTYFVTELLKQPDPNGLYGPYAFGLSAFSGVLQHFGRGGNGQVGIHGTNDPGGIGSNVSHGCIRLRNSDLLWLIKRIPLGAPVRIRHT